VIALKDDKESERIGRRRRTRMRRGEEDIGS